MSWVDELTDLVRSLTQTRSIDLKVWRDRQPDGLHAAFSLDNETRTVPYDSLVEGDIRRLRRDDAVPELPDSLATWLAETIGERDVWVHVGPPAGDLDLLAWPTILGRVLTGTVRYPVSGLGRVADSNGVVALVVSLARSKELYGHHGKAAAYVKALAASLQEQGREVHVFADLDQYETFRDELEGVNVHDPTKKGFDEPPQAALVSASRQIHNPWMAWVHAALVGRDVEVLHLVCHGYHDGHRGALALAQSPSRNDDVHWARFVGDAEVGALVDQLGVENVVLTSPESDFSRVGLRRFARELARWRGLTVALQGVRWSNPKQLDETVQDALELHRSLTRVRIPEPPSAIELSAPKLRVDVARLTENVQVVTTSAVTLATQLRKQLGESEELAGQWKKLSDTMTDRRLMSFALRATRPAESRLPDPALPAASPFGTPIELDWSDDPLFDDDGGVP